MSQTDCIGPMKVAMKIRRDMIAVACDSFMKMFQLGEDELVEQVCISISINISISISISISFSFSISFSTAAAEASLSIMYYFVTSYLL